ncbi:pyrroloquinoline quinone biosynthesis protein PqqF [Pseudomonas asplenii]|uniref:pyrroloquinoline quinone biosynthesis protein PqqF n=1 Tax=Pseudomonas asplenii TaxID=53407 RepID=UPI0022345A53|nr:pyrroloquinoline quinone biosynthesis protein PqqF [Pseudomonas asplenii]UZE28626.1 pyrroloquinoline quinone biosynthesis protein PqqF [Pseudomonas asplenii]
MPAPIAHAPQCMTLANGLRVSLRHAPHLKRCSAALRVAAGSHDAPLAWPGLAHFLEHLVFLGTERFAAADGLMAYVQRHGGQVNAQTRERSTEFFFELPPQAFAGGLERLCDMLARARLAVDEQRREREVLEAEYLAWSRDAVAQRQFQLYAGLSADHPLRGVHAGNRASLQVEEPAFQQALRDFYQDFYQTGQMTLSLVGPQSLEELKTLAQTLTADLRPGTAIARKTPPMLFEHHSRRYQQADAQQLELLLGWEDLPEGARQALDFLCTWLNDSQPGGLSAALHERLWINSLNATPLYQFAGQALVRIECALTPLGAHQGAAISALLEQWLAFFASHADWPGLRREYRLLQNRKIRSSGALEQARRDAADDSPELSQAALLALKALLSQTPPVDNFTDSWRLPAANPFLRSSAPAEHPGLIRGQTSAHRGLRTFAQDRLHKRRDLSAITHIELPTDDSGEAAVYLRWQLDNPSDSYPLQARLNQSLNPLRTQARQAGVELSFTVQANAWQLQLIGWREPIPAILEQALRCLTHPADNCWQAPLEQPKPLIPIRELLRQLSEQAQPANAATPAWDAEQLGNLWADAKWQGMALGFPAAAQPALNNALNRAPGNPTRQAPTLPVTPGEKRWQTIPCDTAEQALLLFCPTASDSRVDEAGWRALGQLIQAPFYQRLRVELQLGYAVFSSVRQLQGRTGLLLGVQSPGASLSELLGHFEAFMASLPERIDSLDDGAWQAQRDALAAQFNLADLPLAQAAELLWQAHLANHSSDYLEQLASAIRCLEREQLQTAARQLNQAAGGWLCLANGPAVQPGWQTASGSLPRLQ